jgi:cobalamin biosynthesis protein CobT
MKGRLVKTALHSAYGLSSTLDRLKIANEVVGFTTADYSRALALSMERALDIDPHYSSYRLEALYNPVLKGFNERMNPRVAERFSSYQHEGRFGYTIVGECVQKIHDRLIQRPENGKVMMVLTDGAPGGWGGADFRGHALKVVGNIERHSPVDIFGVGIGYDVTWLFTNSATIADVSELPGVLMSQLTSQVLSKIHR